MKKFVSAICTVLILMVITGKVTAEFALAALSYNIRRAIALCGGVQKLIDRYRRIAMPKIREIAEI